MKRFLIQKNVLVAIPLLLSVVYATAQTKNNFSGNWVIDTAASNFGTFSNAALFKKMNVIQTTDSLIVDGTLFAPDGSDGPVVRTVYPINGMLISLTQASKRKMTAFLQWSADGKTFIRNSFYSLPSDTTKIDYTSKETWVLSEDKKTLNLNRTVNAGPTIMLAWGAYRRH